MVLNKQHAHMEERPILRSKVLKQVGELITKGEKIKGGEKINALLRILRILHDNLLEKRGNFVSPKIGKNIQSHREEMNLLVDP